MKRENNHQLHIPKNWDTTIPTGISIKNDILVGLKGAARVLKNSDRRSIERYGRYKIIKRLKRAKMKDFINE